MSAGNPQDLTQKSAKKVLAPRFNKERTWVAWAGALFVCACLCTCLNAVSIAPALSFPRESTTCRALQTDSNSP